MFGVGTGGALPLQTSPEGAPPLHPARGRGPLDPHVAKHGELRAGQEEVQATVCSCEQAIACPQTTLEG